MKKIAIFLSLLCLPFVVFSQKNIKTKEVVNFLNKTNRIIKLSYNKLKQNKVYTGGISAAKEYQLKAIDEYRKGEFQAAVDKSYIARRLSFISFTANSSKRLPPDWKLNPKEKQMLSVKVTKNMLNDILDESKVNNEKRKDFNVDDIVDLE